MHENLKKVSSEDSSFMSDWEKGSPMRSFIYYLQRATCGALAYLVLHQSVLGLRMIQANKKILSIFESLLTWISLPGRWIIGNFCDPIRPLYMPPPLASFLVNILFYFFLAWLSCLFYNLLIHKTFVGEKRDPFSLMPRENQGK